MFSKGNIKIICYGVKWFIRDFAKKAKCHDMSRVRTHYRRVDTRGLVSAQPRSPLHIPAAFLSLDPFISSHYTFYQLLHLNSPHCRAFQTPIGLCSQSSRFSCCFFILWSFHLFSTHFIFGLVPQPVARKLFPTVLWKQDYFLGFSGGCWFGLDSLVKSSFALLSFDFQNANTPRLLLVDLSSDDDDDDGGTWSSVLELVGWVADTGGASVIMGSPFLPRRKNVFINPLPFTSISPLSSIRNISSWLYIGNIKEQKGVVNINTIFKYVGRDIWMWFGRPVLSILLAVLTVSPKKQYLGIFSPTTPATKTSFCNPTKGLSPCLPPLTGPVWIPILMCKGLPKGSRKFLMASIWWIISAVIILPSGTYHIQSHVANIFELLLRWCVCTPNTQIWICNGFHLVEIVFLCQSVKFMEYIIQHS